MKKYELNVEGMKCAHCEGSMNEAVKSQLGGEKVVSSAKNSKVTFFAEGELGEDKIRQAVEGKGFVLKSVEVTEAKKTLFGYK